MGVVHLSNRRASSTRPGALMSSRLIAPSVGIKARHDIGELFGVGFVHLDVEMRRYWRIGLKRTLPSNTGLEASAPMSG